MKWLIAAAATVALGVYLGRRVAAAEAVPDDMPDQLPNAIESFANDLIQMPYLLPNVSVNEAQNLRAFLDMIAFAEGTAGENGYYVMFGGGLMTSLADHPRRLFTFTNLAGQQLRTTAAGRYQFLARTWDTLKARLGLPDFGPASQDAAAIELAACRLGMEKEPAETGERTRTPVIAASITSVRLWVVMRKVRWSR